MTNQIVAHFRDGRVVKGTATNFTPQREHFHVVTPDRKQIEIRLPDLKAVFFVRSLAGNSGHKEHKAFVTKQPGKRLVCQFLDGETLIGWVVAYDAKRVGFFLVPDDVTSNNERVFILNAAVKKVHSPDGM